MSKFLLLVVGCCFLLSNAQETQKGGFLYGWDNYTNDQRTGLGSRVVNWDTSGLRDIVHAPEIGIHPRVYFGPSEIPDIKNRLENTPSGQSVKNQIHAYATLLNLGGSYNQNADYALDSDGNRYISNSGAWNMESFYTKLKNQDPTVWNGVPIKSKHRTAALMVQEAFLCLLYAGENDTDVGEDYNTRAQNLAKAMNFWATLALNDPEVNPTDANFNNFGGSHMALCYDLNYQNLSTVQRDNIRKALVKIIPDEPRHGKELYAYANTSNWSTLNTFEIITNLAIEGEEGYKPELTHDWMRALHNFINYGWYPSGAGYEGLGKNYQFVTTLIVAAKRGYSLLPHPHVRAFGEDFLPAIMQPFGKGFTSYDVWGGSGYDPVYGKYKFNAADAVGLKWAFPESKKIDFVWRNYIDGTYANNSTGYVYSQVIPDDSYNNYLMPAAVFAQDYSNEDWQGQANSTIETDYIAMDRGLSVFKSTTDQNALSVQFHARQDMGGHTNSDRLDFTLSGLGRIWIRKNYGGSQFQPSKYHSIVLINDKGVPLTDRDGDKSRQPATVLGHTITPELSKITADATYPYTWEWHWNDRLASQDHQWLDINGWEKVDETFNDFLVTPQSEAHFNIPIYDYGHWHKPENLERIVKKKVNPMEKVVRTVGLIRGEHPMTLIVDDVKKDEEQQNYKWTAQIARDLVVDYYDVNLIDTDYRCDIVLKEPSSTGNRRLLVRILENSNYDGSDDPGYIDILDYIDVFTGQPFNPNPNWERSRLIVESVSISPNFKVLLYPFEEGDELPVTKWNPNHDVASILFSDDEKYVRFYKDELNNTQFELVDENLSTDEFELSSKSLFVYPNPADSVLYINTNDLLKQIEIYTLLGKLVKRKDNIAEKKQSIKVDALTSGVYLLKVTMQDGTVSNKKISIR